MKRGRDGELGYEADRSHTPLEANRDGLLRGDEAALCRLRRAGLRPFGPIRCPPSWE